MSDGTPGGDPDDPDDATLGDGIDEVLMRWLATFLKIAVFIAVPPLYLHRDDPIAGLWRWRKVYLVFLVGTGAVFLPSVLTGDFGVLAVFPFFHLIAAALIGEVMIVTMLPTFAPSLSVPSMSVPIRAEAVAVGAFALAVIVLLRRGVPMPSVGFGVVRRSFSSSDDEYVVPMTEVWKSGGKHD